MRIELYSIRRKERQMTAKDKEINDLRFEAERWKNRYVLAVNHLSPELKEVFEKEFGKVEETHAFNPRKRY